MKLLTRFLVAVVSLVILAVVFFIGSFIVGDMIARKSISEVHAAIEPGMSRAEVVEIYSRNPEISDLGSKSTMQLTHYSRNITSPIVGSWMCIAKIHFNGDIVETVDNVFCVD